MSSDNLGSSSAASSCTLCCGVIDLIFTSCGTWRYWDCYHKLVLTIILSGSACHNTACADRNPISVFAPPTNTNNTLLWPPQSWDPQTPLMGGNWADCIMRLNIWPVTVDTYWPSAYLLFGSSSSVQVNRWVFFIINPALINYSHCFYFIFVVIVYAWFKYS